MILRSIFKTQSDTRYHKVWYRMVQGLVQELVFGLVQGVKTSSTRCGTGSGTKAKGNQRGAIGDHRGHKRAYRGS